MSDTIRLPARDATVVARSDVVVVGGGPAGLAAAVAAARNGASVTLLERYPYLGGLASGGMVLVLDDMNNGRRSPCGACAEMIERMTELGLAVPPPAADGACSRGRLGPLGALGHLRLPHPGQAPAHRAMPPRSTPTAGSASPTNDHGGRRQPAPALLVLASPWWTTAASRA